jgi:ferredoxin
MKAKIDREGCISCELCVETCPEVFAMADDGYAEVIVDEIPEDAEDSAVEAQENCPESVITVS